MKLYTLFTASVDRINSQSFDAWVVVVMVLVDPILPVAFEYRRLKLLRSQCRGSVLKKFKLLNKRENFVRRRMKICNRIFRKSLICLRKFQNCRSPFLGSKHYEDTLKFDARVDLTPLKRTPLSREAWCGLLDKVIVTLKPSLQHIPINKHPWALNRGHTVCFRSYPETYST